VHGKGGSESRERVHGMLIQPLRRTALAALRAGSPVLEQNGWAGKIVPVLVFNRLDVFLACNRALPDEVIARLNAAFVALEQEGVMRRIERAYDHRSVRQTGK
jgi:hypothetical protein